MLLFTRLLFILLFSFSIAACNEAETGQNGTDSIDSNKDVETSVESEYAQAALIFTGIGAEDIDQAELDALWSVVSVSIEGVESEDIKLVGICDNRCSGETDEEGRGMTEIVFEAKDADYSGLALDIDEGRFLSSLRYFDTSTEWVTDGDSPGEYRDLEVEFEEQ